MLHVYQGVLHGDRIEWANGTPAPVLKGMPINVEVTLLDPPPEAETERQERHERAMAALRALAALPANERSFPADAAAWEREIRQDRPLPGRGD